MDEKKEQAELEQLMQIQSIVAKMIEEQKSEMSGGGEVAPEETPAEGAPVVGKKPSFEEKLGAAMGNK